MDRIDYTPLRDGFTALQRPIGVQTALDGGYRRSVARPGVPTYRVTLKWSIPIAYYETVMGKLLSGAPLLVPLSVADHDNEVDYICVIDTGSVATSGILGDAYLISAQAIVVSTDELDFNTG